MLYRYPGKATSDQCLVQCQVQRTADVLDKVSLFFYPECPEIKCAVLCAGTKPLSMIGPGRHVHKSDNFAVLDFTEKMATLNLQLYKVWIDQVWVNVYFESPVRADTIDFHLTCRNVSRNLDDPYGYQETQPVFSAGMQTNWHYHDGMLSLENSEALRATWRDCLDKIDKPHKLENV